MLSKKQRSTQAPIATPPSPPSKTYQVLSMRSRTRQNIHVCLYSLAGIKSYLSDLCHNITWCQKWDREVTKHTI